MFISKWMRTTQTSKKGRQFTSSITLLTWKGVYYLAKRKLIPWSFVRTWERITKTKASSTGEESQKNDKRESKTEVIEEGKKREDYLKLLKKILPQNLKGTI
ncbi:hypothetical protein LCGC14_2465350 [marine sediment metagenome]|uniref:Uncharacterized protein n=1 Tax=marine sediment metagenome TaxID=412755 RepID=A0A0F9DP43_9ZZZZ